MRRVSPEIDTLLFDLDGTLITRHPSSLDVFFRMVEQHCRPPNPEAYRKTRQFVHYYWASSPEAARDIQEYGKFTPAFWENYLARQCLAYGCSTQEAGDVSVKLAPRWEDAYQPETVVAPDVHPTLQTLRDAGYTLGLVSNRSLPFEEEINELGLEEYFAFSFTAGEIESWKPDKRIFDHALNLAGSDPGRSAYIGDNYYADILGARKWGLYPVLIDRLDTFPDAECLVIKSLGDLLNSF